MNESPGYAERRTAKKLKRLPKKRVSLREEIRFFISYTII